MEGNTLLLLFYHIFLSHRGSRIPLVRTFGSAGKRRESETNQNTRKYFRFPIPMTSHVDAILADPEGWRYAQEEKLAETARRRTEARVPGWEPGQAHYKRALRYIDLSMKWAYNGGPTSAGATTSAQIPTASIRYLAGRRTSCMRHSGRPKAFGWKPVGHPVAAVSFKAAATLLLPEAPFSRWKGDADAFGNNQYRRYVSIAQNGPEFARCRISFKDNQYQYEKGRLRPPLSPPSSLVGPPEPACPDDRNGRCGG